MNRSALITGATGFVGSHLAEHLVQTGWAVRALVRRSSRRTLLEQLGVALHEGDLQDGAAIARAAAGVEVVFHLAAVTFAPSEEVFRAANAAGTRTLLDGVLAAHPRPERLVYLSSYAACGPSRASRPRGTDEVPAPLTAYGRSKLEGERVAREAERHGIRVVVLRAPPVYGPRDRALLSYFRLVKYGLAPVPAGAEGRTLHLIYAPDLARALARAADAPGGTYPVAEPVEHPWPALIDSIARAMHRRPLRLALPVPLVRTAAALTESIGNLAGNTPAFNREKAEEMLAEAWTCDLSRSAVLLPPAEATPLAQGMAQTVEWYTRQGWL